MSTISFGNTVNHKQAATFIAANPRTRVLLRGEPGIGKSAVLKTVADMLGLPAIYVDVPNMDLGDIAMPVVDHATGTTKYYPNSRFQLQHGKPVVIMLDEFSKGADPVKNMLHPLLEINNPRLGDVSLHPDTIVFLTGNLTTDGVGDSLKAHTIQRVCVMTQRKNDADEWIQWAQGTGRIAPEVTAWVSRFPHCMASYTDAGQAENHLIYQPKFPQRSCVSPRSAEQASNIINNRHLFDSDTLIAALIGTVGEAAAREMQAFVAFSDQLPEWSEIIGNPKTAAIPTSPGACAITVHGGVARVTKETFAPFMEYMGRFEAEGQAAFAINIAKSAKQAIAFSNRAFADWVAKNQDLL